MTQKFKVLSDMLSATAFSFTLLLSAPAFAVPFQVLLERDTDSGPGTEIFLVTYDSFADLLSNDITASSYSQLNINSDFSVGGMAAEVQSTAVPEPSTLALFGLGLAGLCGRLHRKAVCRTP